MGFVGILQKEIIDIDENLRLRKYDGIHDFALKWYQDEELVYLVDGDRKPYDKEILSKMYSYLNNKGEEYFIEYKEDGKFKPIGDVTLCMNDMPIVIGEKKYRGMGIGYKVVTALIKRAKELGFEKLGVEEIYSYNIGSIKCFKKAGFIEKEKTENGMSYTLNLK